MSAITDPRTDHGIRLRYGTVHETRDGLAVVELDGDRLHAQPAASCLLAPEAGDRVLVSRDPDGRHYVLSVLERSTSPARLAFPGDVEIQAPHGKVRVIAHGDMDFLSGKRISHGARQVAVVAETADVAAKDMTLIGKKLTLRYDAIQTLAETIETVAGRLYQRLRSCFRRVEEVEDVKANRMQLSAREMLMLRGHYAQIRGERHVKITGEQVHMG